MGKVKALFGRLLFEDDQPQKETSVENPASEITLNESEMVVPENFSADVTSGEKAKSIIDDATSLLDSKSYIGQVQEVLDLVGTDADKDVIKKVLTRIMQCESIEDLFADADNRTERIRDIVKFMQNDCEVVRKQSAEDDEILKNSESNAERAYTDSVNAINQNMENAIEEQRKICEQAIENLKKEAEEKILLAKETRDSKLADIASARLCNENSLKETVALTKEVESMATDIIVKINYWLEFIKQ